MINFFIKKRLKSYRKMIEQALCKSTFEQAKIVDEWFNDNITYKKDTAGRIDTKGNRDYYQTLQETLERGTGDCEDYAIAKMHTLIKLGVKREKLRLSFGYVFGESHGVLLYFLSDSKNIPPLVLDNNHYIDSLYGRTDFRSTYQVGFDGVYVGNELKHNNHSAWDDLVSRSGLA